MLTSAGIKNDSIAKALEELVGKTANGVRIAFIPTAANVEEGDKGWLIEDLVNIYKLKLKSLNIVLSSSIKSIKPSDQLIAESVILPLIE